MTLLISFAALLILSGALWQVNYMRDMAALKLAQMRFEFRTMDIELTHRYGWLDLETLDDVIL
jgi:hypothetical protein